MDWGFFFFFFFFFFYKRGKFSLICTALILFPSHSFLQVSASVPLRFFIPVSLRIALLTSSHFAWKVTVISPFHRPIFFFFFEGFFCFFLFTPEFFKLQGVNAVSWRGSVDLQEAHWRWALQITPPSQIRTHVAALVCLDLIQLKACCSCSLLHHITDTDWIESRN